MSSRSYVCFDCKSSVRAESAGGLKTDLRCRFCSKPLNEVSHRLSIPKQSDLKGWDILRSRVLSNLKDSDRYHRESALGQLAHVDRMIAEVSRRKSSTNKETKLKALHSQRRRIMDQYKGLIDDYE